MKQFLVFHGEPYEEGGGWRDFGASFDTLDAAIEWACANTRHRWWHAIDLAIEKEVAHGFDSGQLSPPKWHPSRTDATPYGYATEPEFLSPRPTETPE